VKVWGGLLTSVSVSVARRGGCWACHSGHATGRLFCGYMGAGAAVIGAIDGVFPPPVGYRRRESPLKVSVSGRQRLSDLHRADVVVEL